RPPRPTRGPRRARRHRELPAAELIYLVGLLGRNGTQELIGLPRRNLFRQRLLVLPRPLLSNAVGAEVLSGVVRLTSLALGDNQGCSTALGHKPSRRPRT